jgi:hypothetical protein
MKKLSAFPKRIKTPLLLFAALVATSLLITNTSCTVGADGRPGLAYLSFEWEVSKPEYIDCGTPAVPPNFYYGTFYRTNPGLYTAYYDGKVWNGMAWGSYAWEMDYEIWILPGQRGGYGYNGKDGLNTYLTFVCSPYGPKLFRSESYMRKGTPAEPTRIHEATTPGGEQVIEYTVNEYTIKVTYRAVEPRTGQAGGNFPLN